MHLGIEGVCRQLPVHAFTPHCCVYIVQYVFTGDQFENYFSAKGQHGNKGVIGALLLANISIKTVYIPTRSLLDISSKTKGLS